MNNIQSEFMELIAHLQLKALELLSKNEYNSVIELLNESLDEIFEENDEGNETRTIVASGSGIFATVDRQRVMQEIGDNQALMIFGQEEIENEEY